MRSLPLLAPLLLALTGLACGTEFADPAPPDAGDTAGREVSPSPEDSGRGSCGDGSINLGEECDDGPRNSDTDSDACRSTCAVAACGDLVVDSTEDCDGGTWCDPDCLLTTGCGDGIIQSGEECDDGANEDGDGCSAGCSLASVVCGDGVLAHDEECDDGNTDPVDACTNECLLARCGDGILQLDEECDDGDATGSSESECRLDCFVPVCGDGARDPGEECDDGDPISEDCYLCGRVSSRVSLVNLLGDDRTVSLSQPDRASGVVVPPVASPGAAVAVPLIAGSQVVDLHFSDGSELVGLESEWPMGSSDHYTFVVLGGETPAALVLREDESTPPGGEVRIRIVNAVPSESGRLTVADADRPFRSETILFGAQFGERSLDSTRPAGPFRVEVIDQDFSGPSWIFDLGEIRVGADYSVFVMGTMVAPIVIRTSTSGEFLVAHPLDP